MKILIMHTEVLFWSLSPQAACTTEASACSVRACAWVLGKSFSSAPLCGRNRSLSQSCSLHTRESSVGFPAVPPNSEWLLLPLAGRHCKGEEASSPPSQPIEFKSSRSCFPPPHFPLQCFFVCLLAKVILNSSSCPHTLLTRLNCFLYL